MFLLQAVAAQEVKLESLDNGPGLLPFKLGSTKIISRHHSFIQVIDLIDFENKVSFVKRQLNYIRPQLNNKTGFLFEPHIEYLSSKLNKISDQLQTFTSTRVKRGLIDGLGSVIKGISGNLDYTDALKYNEAIEVLQNNQQKLASQYNDHVSLSKEWTSQHSKILDKIVSNQKKINLMVNRVMNITNTVVDLTDYAHLSQLLLILGDNIEEESEELLRIENVLAFIHAKSSHHSLINLNALKDMLSKLRSLYSNNEILDITIREYIDIIKLGSYYSNDKIVIVFKVPIFLPNTYDSYKLSIVPNKNYQVLIPPSPYIVIHESDYMYIETECPKAGIWYICEKEHSFIREHRVDCVQQLLTSQKIDSSCNLTTVIMNKEAIEQLDERHYTISFPIATKVQSSCERNIYETLRGSYLVTLPKGCFLRTPEFTIMNSNDRTRGQVMKIIDVSLQDPEHFPLSHSTLTLDSINLENLHASNTKIKLQSPVDLMKPRDTTLYHTTIPLYIFLLSATVLVSYIVIKKYIMKFQLKEGLNRKPDVEPATASQPTPDNHSALFSTKVFK